MERLQDLFLDTLEQTLPLKGSRVLEIGCGDGARAVEIARRSRFVTGIDPSPKHIRIAQNRGIRNAVFQRILAEGMQFPRGHVDTVMFSLSLHHIKVQKMAKAITRAACAAAGTARKKSGFIVFLEPGTKGSLFEAELKFDAWDGDERRQKEAAYEAMESHPDIERFAKEIPDETIIRFESVADFKSWVHPKKNLGDIEPFLEEHQYTLNAQRRIHIFRVR